MRTDSAWNRLGNTMEQQITEASTRLAGLSGPAIARLVALPVTGLAALATAHIIVRTLGPEAYGVVMLAATLVLLIPFADLGVGAFVTNAIAENTGDARDVDRALVSAVRVLSIAALIVSTIAVVLAYRGLWAPVFGGGASARIDWMVCAVLLIFACSLPISLGQRILVGTGANTELVAIQAMGPLVTLLLTYVLSTTSSNLVLYAAVWPLGTALSHLAAVLRCQQRGVVRWAHIAAGVFRRAGPKAANVFSTAAPMLVVMIALPVAHQSGRLLVSHLSGSSELADYTIASSLYLPVLSVFSAMGLVLWRRFAEAGRWTTASALATTRASTTFALVAVIAGIGLVSTGPFVADTVSSGEIRPGYLLFASFAALLVAQAAQLPLGMRMTDPIGLRVQAFCSVAMLLTVIVGGIVLTPHLGELAPASVTAVAVLIMQYVPYRLFCVRETRRQADRTPA